MKKILFACFLFHAVCGFSQSETVSAPAIISSKTFGYVDGIRLDSIDAEYAEFDWGFRSLYFNYGQFEKRRKTIITDANGVALIFANQDNPFTLNFFYFNGWQLAPPFYYGKGSYSLLKKREKK